MASPFHLTNSIQRWQQLPHWEALVRYATWGWLLLLLVSTHSIRIATWTNPILLLPLLVSFVTGRWDHFFAPFRPGVVYMVLAWQILWFGLGIHREYFSLNFNFYDTGFFWNPIANFMQGHGFHNSQLGASEFADHFCPGLVLIFGPLFHLAPNPVILPVMRLIFFFLGFLTLRQLLGTYGLEEKRRNFILVLWIINLGVVHFMGFEFQSSNLIVPFVFLAFHLLHRKKYFFLTLVALLMVSLKENGSLVLISLGVFSGLYLKRWIPAMVLTVFGIILLYAIPIWVMPALAGGVQANAESIDPFCCIKAKLGFVGMVLLCSGGLLIFHPRAWFVVLPSFAASLLINRPGAHTLTFHYQDIPLAVCFSVLGFVLTTNPGFLPDKIRRTLLFPWIQFFILGLGLCLNRYGALAYAINQRPTSDTRLAVEKLNLVKQRFSTHPRIWSQTGPAFFLSGEYGIRCILNVDETLADTSPNIIVVCDADPSRWPIQDQFDQFKAQLDRDVAEGKRVLKPEFLPLRVYQRF